MNGSKIQNAVAILSFLIVLGGCAVGPVFKEPVVATPADFRFKTTPSEARADLKWWELFDDPVLYTLVTTALANNQDLKIAVSRIEQARATLGFTRADQYPRIDVDGGASVGNFTGGRRSDTTDRTYYISAPLSWEIDFWGKFRRATAAARAQLLASEYAQKSVQISLVAEVAGTYYILLDFHKRLAISRTTLDSRLESLDIIEQRFSRGLIPELDVNQAQIQKGIAAAAIPEFQRALAKAENALSILLGQLSHPIRTGRDLDSQVMAPQIPTGLPASLLQRRPDIVQARYLLEAQTENIGVAEALRWPSFSLAGTVGAADTEIGSNTSQGGIWSLAGNILGPIFDFKKNIRRVDLEKARTRQALHDYEQTVLTAFKEVEDALVDVQTYQDQIVSVKNTRAAAANAKKLAMERYEQGVTNYLEVLEAERALFDVELQLSELTRQYLNAYVNLYKALGGGWIYKEAAAGR
jgi:multidrug efflux system outer membrane protein